MDHRDHPKLFIIDFLRTISGSEKTPEMCNRFIADKGLIDHTLFFESIAPKYQIVIEDIMSEGKRVILKGKTVGRHLGSFNDIPPTNQPINLPIAIGFTIQNNKIFDHWFIADQITLLRQIGVDL